jgi:hypothetical protein
VGIEGYCDDLLAVHEQEVGHLTYYLNSLRRSYRVESPFCFVPQQVGGLRGGGECGSRESMDG